MDFSHSSVLELFDTQFGVREVIGSLLMLICLIGSLSWRLETKNSALSALVRRGVGEHHENNEVCFDLFFAACFEAQR